MKLLSFYLPQFHEIPENNDAWGHGFTEWTNVKKSKPLYWGHYQPRKPLNNNYYNLLDDGVLKWQASLAEKYGVSGFCFYHYWFNGRLVLEKPVELLRKNNEIKLNYCFAWANEPWTKTWHGAGGNKEILIPQTYGREEEWRAHYEYFRPYFKDERYIKEGNRPMLLVYKLQNIPAFNDMIRYWNRLAKEDGFEGMFVVSMNTGRDYTYKSKWVDATVDFEPNKTKAMLLSMPSSLQMKENGGGLWNRLAVKAIYYTLLNEQMLKIPHKKNQFRTVFVNYDDSPRRGKSAVVTKGATPARFEKYLKKTLLRSIQEKNEYVFINAWNEWGEGNYLEPDQKFKYVYLEAVRTVMKEIE